MSGAAGRRPDRIGIGIITHNRESFFRECITALPEADAIIVINDGDPYPATAYPSRVSNVIQHQTNRGVGISKNEALRALLELGCNHLFLSEDDIRVVDPDVCARYIRASQRSGIAHFNFAYHGYENKSSDGKPLPARKTVPYGEGVSICLHRQILGAFQYFNEEVLRTCGFMDPFFRNMFEHVEHTYRIIEAGYHPPFWWFADICESNLCFHDLDPSHAHSTIRNRSVTYRLKMKIADTYFALKHGSFVMNIPDRGEREAEAALRNIRKLHGIPSVEDRP